MKKTALTLSLLMGLLATSLPARADDKSAATKLADAIALYNSRTDAAKVTQALALIKAAITEATSDEVKYDLMMLQCKVLYWKGTHTTGDANKITIHDEAKQTADAAKALLPDYADAFYWSAAHLGRWAEAKGIIASLSKKNEIMKTLEAIFELNTRAGDAGETLEGFGPDRILGRLYFKLPGFAGGNLATSIKHLDVSYTKGPQIALNMVWYAESLAGGNASQKAKAKQILDEMLAKDPNTLNLDRVPETIEEFKDARTLRTQLGK